LKALKYLLIAAGSLVALAGLVIAVIAATFDPNKYKPEIAALVKEKTGRTLTMEGRIGLSFFPGIGAVVGKISLSEPGSGKIFAKLDEAKLSLALMPLFSRRVVVDRVTLSGLTLDLVQHKGGRTNFGDVAGAGGQPARAAAPKAAPPGGAINFDVAGIEILSSAIGWRDESSGTELKASVAEFKTGRIASGVPGKLSLSARIEEAKPPIKLQVKLSSGYRFDFEKQSFAFSGVDLRLADEAPGGAGSATSLKGDAEFDLAPSAVRFDLAIDRFNLDRYLPPARAGAGDGAHPGGKARAGAGVSAGGAETPIDLSALKELNLKGALRIGELTASNVKAEKISMGLRAAGGRLEVNPLAANLYRGSLAGNASVNANANQFAIKSQLTGVAIGPLLRDALGKDLLEGAGNVALDLRTSGNTVGAMKKALSGSASLALRDGAIKGINLTEVLRRAKSLSGAKPTSEQAASDSERTDFAELGASFVIKNGVAHNEDLSGKSPLLRLTGSGDVNVGADSLDYLVKASVVATSAGQGGKELADLRGLTVPVHITGPLDAPKFRVDFGTAAGQAVRQRAEEKVKERLQDKLKGLFGR
jgi:AsmA protein